MYEKLLKLIENENKVEIKKDLKKLKEKIDEGKDLKEVIYNYYQKLDNLKDSKDDDEFYVYNLIKDNLISLMDKEFLNKKKHDKVVIDLMKKSNEFRKENINNKKGERKEEKGNKFIEYNNIAVALKTCAILEGIIGYVSGVIMAFSIITTKHYFPFALMLTYFLFTGVCIVFTLGLSEVIQILHDIRKKLLK